MMNHRGLNITNIQELHTASVLYTEDDVVITPGDTINVEWLVLDVIKTNVGLQMYCRRRLVEEWSDDEVIEVLNNLWQEKIDHVDRELNIVSNMCQEDFTLELIDQDGNVIESPSIDEHLERRVDEINSQAPKLIK